MSISIEYVDDAVGFSGNKIYAGQLVCLEAKFDDDKDPNDYEYFWFINTGDFEGGSQEVNIGDGGQLASKGFGPTVLMSKKFGPGTCLLTSGKEGEQILVKVCAVLKDTISKETKGKEAEFIKQLKRAIESKKGFYSEKRVPGDDKAFQDPSSSDLTGHFSKELDDLRDDITPLSVSLNRTKVKAEDESDLALWVVIRNSTDALSFDNYTKAMDAVLCGLDDEGSVIQSLEGPELYRRLRKRRFLPFNDTDAYRLLKTATEAFLLVNSGINITNIDFTDVDAGKLTSRLGGSEYTAGELKKFWDDYLGLTNGTSDPMLPYLAIIRKKLKNEDLKSQIFRFEDVFLSGQEAKKNEKCIGILQRKLTSPFLFELIWSYWQEEGMLVQTLNAITRRFQNMRSPGEGRDPLAGLEIDTLRPLSNLLWGYVQDEQHRLNIVRRVYEYEHHYGISLQGKAVPKVRSADSRSKFIEAFHHLLQLSSIFFKQDDDTTVIADGFPLLNAIKEVHLVLSQGAHNQFGDLPSTARQEMLIQQWLLARPEFREFLPTRIGVAYPEPWMDRVEAMKYLQGWTDTSINHFHNLAVFGEQILLGIRYGAWSKVNDPAQAANWARFWRSEIQGYLHAYRAVTGVDLSSITSNRVDSTPPSVHLYNRYMNQARRV